MYVPHNTPPPDTVYGSPFAPYFRRHTPSYNQPDFRIHEMNKRLQQRTEESDNLWWNAFATEFFDDEATLTLSFCLEDGPKRYSIGRPLIPRYFRSLFEGGVTELYFMLRQPKESFLNTHIVLECDHCAMVTHYGKASKGFAPEPIKDQLAKDNSVVVCTEGKLKLEFLFDDLMRIRSWHFDTRQHRELVSRNTIAMQNQPPDSGMLEQLSKNITRQGLTNSTLNYLRLCVILEPMQELMSRHKAYSLSPRDCLKTTLFQKWQRLISPQNVGGSNLPGGPPSSKCPQELETQRPQNKRRKRKTPANNGKKKNMSPGPPPFPLTSQDQL